MKDCKSIFRWSLVGMFVVSISLLFQNCAQFMPLVLEPGTGNTSTDLASSESAVHSLSNGLNDSNSFSKERGGSNFVFLRQSDYSNAAMTTGCDVDGVRSVFSVHHQARGLVSQKLQEMRNAGQKKIAFVIWHFDDGNKHPDDMSCFQVKTSEGRLSPQHATNLKNLLLEVSALGFDEVQLRLAPYKNSAPEWWTSYNESQAQSNWRVIQHVHQIGDEVRAQSPERNFNIVYDLGLELGGLWAVPKSWRKVDNGDVIFRYASMIWNLYVDKYGTRDTMGFSLSASAHTVRGSHEFYVHHDRGLPAYLGLDIYASNHDPKTLRNVILDIVNELKARNLMDRAFIQETYFNSTEARAIFDEVAKSHGTFRTLMQWPHLLATGNFIEDPSSVAAFSAYGGTNQLVVGAIDGIQTFEGQQFITGWSCTVTVTAPVFVHLYVGDQAGRGTFISSTLANLASETAVGEACRNNSQASRFRIPITSTMMEKHAYSPIFVYGISNIGLTNNALEKNGHFKVPQSPALKKPENEDKLASIPVFRFFKAGNYLMTLNVTEGFNAGYSPEGVGFVVFANSKPESMRPIYRCFTGHHHFISNQAHCEGTTGEGLLGYLLKNPGPNTAPVYRFYKAETNQHLITTNVSEALQNNFVQEMILGHTYQ